MTAGDGGLYQLLGVAPDASQAEIKKAYHRLALRLHPDKVGDGDRAAATDKFQHLQRVFAVLSDPAKRAVYDRTGSMADTEDLTDEKFASLYEYYRGIYKKVTEDDVREFERAFRGSEGERRELLELYERFGGDMPKLFGWLCCSRPKVDAHRFCEALEAAIAAGTVARTAAFTKWAKKVRASPKPKVDPLAPEPKPAKAKRKADPQLALVAQIQGKNADRMDGLVASLAAKYGKPAKKKKKAKKTPGKGGPSQPPKKGKAAAGVPADPLSDAEFEKIRAKLGR